MSQNGNTKLHVHKFGGENVGIIKSAEYVFGEDGLLVVGGKNEQGKTTFVNLIDYALGGKDALPAVPLRKGAANGSAWVDLGEYLVKRTFTPRGTEVTAKSKDGYIIPSPQKLFDSLLTPFQLDIMAITRMKTPKEKVQYVKQVLGIDTAELDEEYKRVYETRTQVGAQKKSAWERYEAIDVPDDTPDAEISVADLSAELQRLNAANEEIRAFAGKIDRLDEVAQRWEQNLERIDSDIAALEEKLEAMRRQRTTVAESLESAQAESASARADLESMPPLHDISAITERLQQSDSINRAVRLREQQHELWDAFQEAEAKWDEHTARLAEIDREKRELVAKANLPGGLEISEGGLLLDELPFEQASASRQRRVILAILLAAKPALPFYVIRDGSLLDEEAQREAAEMIREAGAQLAIEVVGTEGATIIIEDGAIREAVAA